MTDLLIDLGNTRLKWAQSAPGVWMHAAALHRGRVIADVLDEAWRGLAPPRRVVVASVAGNDVVAALAAWTQRHWGLAPQQLRAQRTQLDVVNTYREPATLGADRWAALLAARAMTERDCAVVSCGTAVTVDVLSSEGVFAGGVIFPGLRLLRESLGAGTAGVGLAEGDDASCLAHSTADAVAAGTLFGLAGAIERCLLEHEHALTEPLEVYLTGGDAPVIGARLARPALQVPDLVLKGVARAVETL